MSVRRQCQSWSIERGNLWKRVTSISFVCVRNVYSAHNQFPAITQTERMVDRTGKPVEEITGIAEERESSSAQMRTLFNEQRRTIIAECCEKVSHHETPSSSSRTRTQNSTGRIMVSNRIFVKFINKILLRWRNYENSRVLPSIRSPDRSSSRIRTLLWNYLEDYKNCKMK